ncbi:branched-chain amino acid ABC transporter permease [Chloroflexales bacterium ZM16-3]|nr:branched-chain amino acid ABC transporter permease [Chloroflexales bacterium ZM16-3]
MLYELTQSLVSGLLIGSAFAVLSVGFSLAWGVNHVLNVAHTTFAILAAYIGYWALKVWGLDPVFTLVGIGPLFFVIGVVLHETLIKMTARRTNDLVLSTMVLTFGLAVIVENVMQSVWTPDPRIVETAYTGKALNIGPISLAFTNLVSFALAAVTIAGLYLFSSTTYTGKAVRAVWQNPTGAALAGINLTRVTSITFGLSLATAGVGGVAMSLIYAFDPATHLAWLIYVFLVVILGGVGSILGATLAGLIIGLIIGVSGVFIPLVWVNFVLFVLLIALLLIRPDGLLRR